MTKQLLREATWWVLPMPVMGLPAGMMYLKWSSSPNTSWAVMGLGYFFSMRSISRAMRQCMSSGDFSKILPKLSFMAYLLTHTRAASSSPLKYFKDAS